MRSWSLILVVLIAMTLVSPLAQTSAQEATPSADASTPIAISASECTVTPRTAEAIAEIVSATSGVGATPVVELTEYTRPEGTPADAATIAEVEETIRQLVACINAGDFLRFLAQFSNDALRRYADDLGLPLATDDVLLTPDPTQNETVALGPIEDILVLADGRVSALASIPDVEGDDGDGLTTQFLFMRQGDRWLIDELFPIAAESTSRWTIVEGDGFRGAIVDAATAPELARWLTGQDNAPGWEPTPAEIAVLEAKLPGFLRTAQGAAPDLWSRVPTYLRQYAGVFDSDDRQMILVNAFCDAVGLDWQAEPVLVMDGGDCFFSVIYVVETRTFTNLSINGDA